MMGSKLLQTLFLDIEENYQSASFFVKSQLVNILGSSIYRALVLIVHSSLFLLTTL